MNSPTEADGKVRIVHGKRVQSGLFFIGRFYYGLDGLVEDASEI